MELIGESNNRQIFYTNVWGDKNWLTDLPTHNWLVFPIGQNGDMQTYNVLAEKCLDNNVLYVCAVGEDRELIHDLFDETIVANKIESGDGVDSPDDFENSPMTTAHGNFSEGFWFAIMVTYHELHFIERIVCVDFSKNGVKKHLMTLIDKINQDWLPSDEENEEAIYDTVT